MFRSASPSDVNLLLSAGQIDPVSVVEADRFRRELALGQYRLEWSWIHYVGDRLLARALWWGQSESAHPVSLDCLWVDPSIREPAALAGRLLRAGHAAFRAAGMRRLPDVNMSVPTNWRDDPRAVAAVKWRSDAAAGAGVTEIIERLSFVWTPDKRRPARSTRLTFEPASDDQFLQVFAQVARGSLDIHTQRDVGAIGSGPQAADDLQFYRTLPGDRQLWRLAHNQHGVRVGFIIPSRSAYDASVSYLGVIAEHRGQGLVNDLLAEITIIHADNGAPRITGTTDTTNSPMAAAFHRAGYDLTTSRVVIEPIQA